jgi:hypothetical protein
MLHHEDSCTTHDNRYFKISLLHLLPLCTVSYRLIFWGNLTDSNKVFYIQKKIIRIVVGVKSSLSCRKLFWKFNMLPLASEFILCLLSFVVENFDRFQRNTDVHNLNTRRKYDLHMPNTDLTKYQKGVYYTGIKLSIIYHLQLKV